ncbi:SPOC domain-containing protein, partial [Cardiosporidium cionae]
MSFRPSAYGSSLTGTSQLPLHPHAPNGPPHVTGGDSQPDAASSVSLLLTSLPKDATEDEFEVLFRPFGEIKALQIQQNASGHAISACVHLLLHYASADLTKLRKSLSIRGCHLKVTFVDNPRPEDGGLIRYSNRGRSHTGERSSRGGGRGGNRYFEDGMPRETPFSDRNAFRMRKGEAFTSSMKRPRGDISDFSSSGSMRISSEGPPHYKGPKNEHGDLMNWRETSSHSLGGKPSNLEFPPPTIGSRNLCLCDLVKQFAPHVFTRKPISEGTLSSAVEAAASTQTSMISSFKQAPPFPPVIPLNLSSLGIPQPELLPGSMNTFTAPTGILSSTGTNPFVDSSSHLLSHSNKLLSQPTSAQPSNLLPSTHFSLPTMMVSPPLPEASSQPSFLPIPAVVWRGILARNDKKRVNVNAIALIGNVSHFLNNATILNVNYRLKWDEVASRPMSAVCYFEVVHEEQKAAFLNYLEYFITKDRAGAVTIREDVLLYLIPPKVDLFRQLGLPEGLPENILIGLFGSISQQSSQTFSQPPQLPLTSTLPSSSQNAPKVAPPSIGGAPLFPSNATLPFQQPPSSIQRMHFPSSQAASSQPFSANSMGNPPPSPIPASSAG